MPGPVNNMGGTTAVAVDPINVITPAGPVPTPLPNVINTATIIPNVPNIFYGGLPIVNQMTENPVSVGSVPNGGVATAGMCQDAQNIGCSTVLNTGGMMSTSMADATGHNKDFNSFAVHMTPSPPAKWMTLR